ncbi:MAG: hypothetical protein RBU30_05605 [Polyangia bacterium]|nr:hypothetical protein [Polyangia bacterium]
MRQSMQPGGPGLSGTLVKLVLSSLVFFGLVSSARAETNASLELALGALFDNNAALGRRGQFGAEAVVDIASVVGVVGSLSTDLGSRARFQLFGKLRSEEGRWRDYLRNTEVTLKPGVEIDLTSLSTLRPEVSFKLRREVEEIWGYLEVAPSLNYTLHTKLGLLFEVSYEHKATLYDSDALTNTYANVDRLSHLGRLRARIWQSQFLRFGAKAEVEHQTWDGNLGEKLARIMFLPIESYTDPDAKAEPGKRKDVILRGELELLGVAWKGLGIAFGYRAEYDHSTLDAFKSVAHGPRLAAVFSHGRHEAFLEARLSFYDFFRFRYDVRYADTRKDLKTEVFAAYQVSLAKGLKLGAKATFLRNDSNDASTYPDGRFRFDPSLSRSYSLYQGTRIEAFLSYTWETSADKPAPPKDKDEVPGTILAGR